MIDLLSMQSLSYWFDYLPTRVVVVVVEAASVDRLCWLPSAGVGIVEFSSMFWWRWSERGWCWWILEKIFDIEFRRRSWHIKWHVEGHIVGWSTWLTSALPYKINLSHSHHKQKARGEVWHGHPSNHKTMMQPSATQSTTITILWYPE